MYRIARVVRTVFMVMVAVVALMFVPPIRNILTLGQLPGLWKEAPTLQLIKAQVYSYSSDTSALSSCAMPARAPSPSTGQRDRVQQLLESEPYTEARAQSEDVESQAKAWKWLNASSERRDRYLRYMPQISPVDKSRLMITWRVMQEVLKLHNISYFAVDGTLLGAFRHGGLIPWDDDIDVAVDGSDVDKVRRVLSCVPGYTLRIQPSMHWKFFWNDAPVVQVVSTSKVRQPRVLEEGEKKNYEPEYHPLEDVVMRFPFVDIFLVTSDGSYIWTLANFNVKTNLYPVEDVYPLVEVKYEGQLVPVPRRSARLLHRMYQPNTCASAGHNHREGHGITSISVIPCHELNEVYTVYPV